jgi:hypothetical protein
LNGVERDERREILPRFSPPMVEVKAYILLDNIDHDLGYKGGFRRL